MKAKDVLNNEYVKKGLTTVGNVLKTGFSIVAPIVVTTLATGAAKQLQDKAQFCGVVGYGDAVKAILESNMYSSGMEEAISLLEKGRDSEYYKAVIRVVGSNTYSSAKLRMIKEISGKLEGEA